MPGAPPPRPAPPRWKRSKTCSSSPGARPGPRSRTSSPAGERGDLDSRARGRVGQIAFSTSASRIRSASARLSQARAAGPAALALEPLRRSAAAAPPSAAAARVGERRSASRSPAALRSPALAELEQLVDHQREPVELGQRGVELLGDRRVARVGAGRLHAQAQPGQRRAELVRRVGDEVALGAHEPLQPCGHVVERGRERALLRAALDLSRGRRDRPPATRRAARSSRPHRPRDLPGDDGAGEQPEPDARAGRSGRARRPSAADRAVDGVDGLRDAHGADRAALDDAPGPT